MMIEVEIVIETETEIRTEIGIVIENETEKEIARRIGTVKEMTPVELLQ